MGSALIARCLAAAGVLSAVLAISASPAMALTVSHNVALIPSNQPSPAEGIGGTDGILPISTTVAGNPNESFAKFSFTDVALSQITSAELSQFDTVVLNQVKTGQLSASAKSALAQFVAGGGKLLIHDADLTTLNDYSWVLGGSGTTQVGAGCNDCGATSGTSTLLANSPLISANPSDPSYVNLADMSTYTDAVGDSNLLTSTQGQSWVAAVRGTNANGEQGAQLAYATKGTGLAIYNGFDTDMIMPTATSPWRCVSSPDTQYVCPAGAPHEQVDWLAQMWYNELNLGAVPSGHGSTQVSSIGTTVAPSQAGLPPTKACLAKRTLRLRLTKLIRRHRKVVQIDVYVNGHLRLREHPRRVHITVHGHHRVVTRDPWHNVTLTHLPKTGTFVIKIVATTSRRYHLISKARYTAC